jgi:hypothetical protein
LGNKYEYIVAYHFNSKDKLNIELGWETIRKRADILGLNFFHKIHLNETRPLIKNCMTKLDIEGTHKTRSKGGVYPIKTLVLNSKLCFFHTLLDSGTFTNTEFKPPRFKHFSWGNKFSNTLLTNTRVAKSYLNQHKLPIGLAVCATTGRSLPPIIVLTVSFTCLSVRLSLTKLNTIYPDLKPLQNLRS